MEQPPPPPPGAPSSSQPTPQSTDTPPPQQPPQQQPPPPSSSSSSLPPSITNSNSNPNPNSTNILASLPQPPNRPPQQFGRPWSQPPSQFSHFPPQFQPPSAAASPSSAPIQRGGIAIGVPAAAPPAVSSQPASFSPSFVGAQYGAVPRANVSDSSVPSPASSSAPGRPSMHGMPNMGMMGTQIRPGGVPPSAVHQQRPVQTASGIRPQNASNNLPPVPQNFQGHGILRGSSLTPSSSTPSTSQSQPSTHQPWLSSAPQGRPPLPSQSYRPQTNTQSLQQRSHIPQQSPQPMPATSQPQQLSSSHQQQQQQQQQQQPFPTSNQSQDTHGQQSSSSRVPQPSPNPQQIARSQGVANQKPPSPAVAQPSTAQLNHTDQPVAEATETCNRILGKRNIQELVNQIDPSEKLDPDVEDVLVDIAEDFIESVTTFGCSLAKHRKSNTLEAKDILLHLERTWNIALPGFSGDEIKTYKKPVINDIHRERLAVVKKSIAAGEAASNKSSGGAAAGNVKGHMLKAAPNVVG